MKRLRLLVLPIALMLAMALPGTALAAGNTTEVEQKWIDFQKAVTDQMVKDGTLTRQDADARVKEFQAKFAESPGDSIYEFFADKHAPRRGPEGGCKDGKCRGGKERLDGAAYRVYSMLTGRNVDELKKATVESGQTIWELARNEGKLELLKSKLTTAHTSGLDAMVKSGVLSDQKRINILERLKNTLDSK